MLLGKSKVFLKAAAETILENTRTEKLQISNNAAKTIQG